MRTPNAEFAVALPTGEWAQLLRGSHIDTHQGRVDLPGFDVGYLDITRAPVFRIAGQAQVEANDSRAGTWEWTSTTGKWEHVSPNAHGTYPVMYDSTGTLHIATPEHNGSQGWRFESETGELVTGDDSLNPLRSLGRALGLKDLWEFTHYGGVTIGQGEPPIGCHVLIDGTRRLLEPGDTHFIRVRYAEGMWAIAMTKLAQREAVIHWMLKPQLLQLPVIDEAAEPNEPPKPEPQPMPEYHIPEALNDQRELVTEVRDTLFPTLKGKPLNDEKKAMLMTKTVAWRLRQHGVGLVKAKPGSENNVDGYTSDIVALKNGVHWDIQQDGHTGAAFPQWSLEPNPDNYPPIAGRWTPAVNPGGAPEPQPEPQPGQTHPYEGGDNDTGDCDTIINGVRCGLPPSDPVHAVSPLPEDEDDDDGQPSEPIPDSALALLRRIAEDVVENRKQIVALSRHLGAPLK